jgi:hypothetical protein
VLAGLFALASEDVALAVTGGPADIPVSGADRGTDDADRARKLRPPPFWIDGGIGYQHVSLTTFRAEQDPRADVVSADLVASGAGGPALNLGAGVRVSQLTIGARGSFASLGESAPDGSSASLQLYSIDLELAVRLFSARVEPYVLLGGGYSALGNLGEAVGGLSGAYDVDGANARAGLGVDYYVTPTFTLGARAAGELLFLTRSGVALGDVAEAGETDSLNQAEERIIEGDGSSVGAALSFTLGPGLRF